jgi:DNA repair exonuclease SbcCD ATPase subunit
MHVRGPEHVALLTTRVGVLDELLNDGLEDAYDRLDNAAQGTAGLTRDVRQVSTRLEATRAVMSIQQGRITTSEDRLSDVVEQVLTSAADRKKVSRQIGAMHKRMLAMENAFKRVESRLDDAHAEGLTLRSLLGDAEADVSMLRGQLESADAAAETTRAELTNVIQKTDASTRKLKAELKIVTQKADSSLLALMEVTNKADASAQKLEAVEAVAEALKLQLSELETARTANEGQGAASIVQAVEKPKVCVLFCTHACTDALVCFTLDQDDNTGYSCMQPCTCAPITPASAAPHVCSDPQHPLTRLVYSARVSLFTHSHTYFLLIF